MATASNVLTFGDIETTSLDVETAAVWQVAVTRAVWDTDRLLVLDKKEWLVTPSADEMRLADPQSLEVNHFHEVLEKRGREFAPEWTYEMVEEMHKLLRDTTFVGAVPSFDTIRLERIFRSWELEAPWHYHLVDVLALVAAKTKTLPPWSSRALTEKAGVVRDMDMAHDARHDVEWAMRMFEAAYR